MNIQIKNTVGYLVLFLIVSLTNVSCSNKNIKHIFHKSNLTQSEKYLQTATYNSAFPENYGYIESNPIILKLSPKLNYDSIIDEFINRLYKNGEEKSYGKLQKFELVEKLKIPIKNYQNQENESKLINDFSSSIYACKIISEDKSETITLYFKLNHKFKKLYRPSGFIYDRLCG